MAEPLDTVAFELIGVNTGLKAAAADAEKTVDTMVSNIQKKTSTTFTPAKASAAELAAEIEKLTRKVATGFDDGGRLKAYKVALAEVTAASKTTAVATEAVTEATKKGHGATAMATREFRALFDELSSGRTRQTPGTLAIIATRVFGISGATLLWSVALAAIPVAFIAAAVSAEQSMARIRTAIALTGNASGVSAAKIAAMGGGGGLVGGGNLKVLGGLIGAGVPGADLAEARNTVGQGQIAGLKSEEVTKQIGEIFRDPSEAAKELNKQMFLLTAAQTREVDDLQKRGDYEGAARIVLDQFNSRTKEAADAAGGLAHALSGAGGAVAGFWAWIGHLGKAPTNADRIAALNSQLQGMDHMGLAPNAPRRLELIQERDALVRSDAAAAAKAAQDAAQAERTRQINAGLGLRSKLDVDGLKEEEKANAKILTALAVKAQLIEIDNAKKRGATPAQMKVQEEILANLKTEAKNANDPNYKWGRGDPKPPKGPKHPGIGSGEVEDQATKDRLQAELGLAQSLEDRFRIQKQINAIEEKSKIDALSRQLTEAHITGAARDRAMAQEKLALRDKDALARRNLQEGLEAEAEKQSAQILQFRQRSLRAQAASAGNEEERGRIEAQMLRDAQAAEKRALGIEIMKDQNIKPGDILAKYEGMNKAQGSETQAQLSEALTKSFAPVQALKSEIELQEKSASLKYADAKLRAKELADLQLKVDLIRQGFAPGTPDYEARFKTLQPLYQQKALGAANDNDSQIIGQLHSGLEGLFQVGDKGFKNLRQGAQAFLQDLATMALKLYIIRPLLNAALGTGDDKLGGWAGNALSAATGGVSGFLSSLFGGGRATGGFVDPGKFYVVGEHGPEILGPGVAGRVTPMTAANANSQGGGAMNVHHTYEISVSGNGDKELLGRMQQVAAATVDVGIRQYSKTATRNMRGTLIQSQKRALY